MNDKRRICAYARFPALTRMEEHREEKSDFNCNIGTFDR